MPPALYAILSVILVSVLSVLVILPLYQRKIAEKWLVILVSLSAGTLFGGAFFHLLPEGLELNTNVFKTMGPIMLGIFVFFILEKFIHWHHRVDHPSSAHKQMHGHAYHLAPLNLIGDGIHNFIDGIVIATSYLVSVPLGIAATVSVILHEIPQELADFGVLLYAGLSRKKALLYNFLSAGTALVGAVFGLLIAQKVPWFEGFMLPFAAGSFIYIAGTNLVPELHKHCKVSESLVHILAFLVGLGLMIGLLFL